MKKNCSTGESPARDAIDEAPRLRLRRSIGAWDRLGLGPELPPASDTKKDDNGPATDAPPARRRRRNGNPRLSGGQGREGRHQRLVRAAVDLGLELRRHGIQGLLEVRVVAATVRLLQPLPG